MTDSSEWTEIGRLPVTSGIVLVIDPSRILDGDIDDVIGDIRRAIEESGIVTSELGEEYAYMVRTDGDGIVEERYKDERHAAELRVRFE